MHNQKRSSKQEMQAMYVSITGNLFFVFAELFMYIYTRSQAVLMDAVYDGVEFFMLLPSVFLIPYLYRPLNEKHPFGYTQIESLFVAIKGSTMIAVTAGLVINNVEILLHGGRNINFSAVAWFEFFVFVIAAIVSRYLAYRNKTLNSKLIEMEIEGWKIDGIVSFGLTIAYLTPLFVRYHIFPGLSPLLPYLDQIFTILLSVYMIREPASNVMNSIRDLCLIPPEEKTVEEIKETLEPYLADLDYDHLYYEIVRTGRKLWISAYIKPNKKVLYLPRLREIQEKCVEALGQKWDDYYFELLPDVEYKEEEISTRI